MYFWLGYKIMPHFHTFDLGRKFHSKFFVFGSAVFFVRDVAIVVGIFFSEYVIYQTSVFLVNFVGDKSTFAP